MSDIEKQISNKQKFPWKMAMRFMIRSLPNFQNREKRKNLPQPNGIYKCFEKNEFFSSSVGWFMLTDTHLSFYVTKPKLELDHNSLDATHLDVPYSQYAFVNTQIKDISSICANYWKIFNPTAFLIGLFLLLIGLVLPIALHTYIKGFLAVLCYIGAAGGLVSIIGAFSFWRSKAYKINIGTPQGGITIMGSSGGKSVPSSVLWQNSMTVVYNAKPFEYELINFIEKINLRITLLQERGEFAFEDCLSDKEVYCDE